MNFTTEDFKRCLGSFTTGVTIITLIDASCDPQGVTISSFSSLSQTPAMLSFNLGKDSYLHSKLLNSDCFAVNILAESQVHLSRKFAERQENRFDGVTHTTGMHGCPLLDGAASFIECLTDNIYDGGDHSIITGKIVNLSSNATLKPLVYFQGGYYSLGDKII